MPTKPSAQLRLSFTDSTGQHVISYAGDDGPAQSKTSNEASTGSSNLCSSSFRDILLPSGEQPVGDPPDFIREIALRARKKKR